MFSSVTAPVDAISVFQATQELEDLNNRAANLKAKGFKDTKHIRMSSIDFHLNAAAKMITANEIPGLHLMTASDLIGAAETKLLESVQTFDPLTGEITDTVPDFNPTHWNGGQGTPGQNGKMSRLDTALLVGGGSVVLLALLLAVRR